MILADLQIDHTWTLFLDRDGVINKRMIGDYIRTWEQFEFLPGVMDAMRIFSARFGRVVVVSNQQGIGKGLMTDQELGDIHGRMTETILNSGGRIDKVYYSPHLEEEGSFLRKPNVGMALRAQKDFPAIRMNKSLMAGDSLSDMIFGRRCKMKTVLLSASKEDINKGYPYIDFAFPDLVSFANNL